MQVHGFSRIALPSLSAFLLQEEGLMASAAAMQPGACLYAIERFDDLLHDQWIDADDLFDEVHRGNRG
jgi:hypothetical protein